MSDVCGAFVRWECVQECSDPSPCFLDGSCLGLADECLEFGEHHLDRVEIGAVWRQEEEMGTGIADCLSGSGALVTAEIVEDDDIAGCERGHEELLDPGGEGEAVDRAVKDQRRDDTALTKPGQESQCLPMTVRNLVEERSTARAPAPHAGHVGLDPGLIDEDETAGVEPMLMGLPPRSEPSGLRPIPLARQQRFFYS